MKGKVKSYNPSTRYGFITADDTDYRFHIQDWNLRLPPAEGLRVEFMELNTEKGWRAAEIRRVKDV